MIFYCLESAVFVDNPGSQGVIMVTQSYWVIIAVWDGNAWGLADVIHSSINDVVSITSRNIDQEDITMFCFCRERE